MNGKRLLFTDMETTEDVVNELLGLVEASSTNPMEEFLNDLVQVSSKDMVEQSFQDFLEIPIKNKIDEILDDLIDATYKDKVEELLNDTTKISSLNKAEEEDLTDASTKDTMNRILAVLEEASTEDTMNQQLLKNLVTINEPMEEILKEMSTISSFKDSTTTLFKNSFSPEHLKAFPEHLEEESSEALITEQSAKQSNAFNPNDSDFIGKAYSMCTSLEKSVIYRRNDPGTTREEWCNWPAIPFEEMDNTLNVQQYIQQCIHKDPSDVDTILKSPPGQEEGVWKYEHVRQFCMQLNGLTLLLQDECKPDVCVQMTATEQWIFLCAAHKNPKECSAIDYTRHTLDGAAALLNSNKYFPSRVSIKESSIAKIGSVCRRIYRIFSHAYFHHPELFEKFETETHLCRRFTIFVKKYNLMANEHLIVPILEQKPNHS